MDVFSLVATLELQADNFFSGLADAAEAMVQFAADSVKVGANFDYAMAGAGAVSNATADEMEKLRQAALDAGASTKFTAEESANALYYMGLAGWDVNESISGLNAVLNLAAASGSDLARTSDIVTDAMTAFGLSAEDTAHFADVLAATSTNANTTVDLMGETFKYIAPVAGAMGYSIEEMGLAIGLMANMGVKGSRAGTALRNVITRLASPTDELQTAMETLGVTAFDAAGNALPFIDVMEQLRGKIGGMSEESKAVYSEIFAGKFGLAGFEAIINATEDDFNKLKEAIDNCDDATQILAERMQDNLQGSFTEWNSAVQDFQIAVSDKLTPTIREFVDFGKNRLREFTTAFREEGLDGALEVFEKFVTDGSQMIQDKLPVFQEKGTKILNAISKGLEIASPAIGSVIETLGTMVGQFLEQNAPTITSTITTIVSSLTPGIVAALKGVAAGLIESWPVIWSGIQEVAGDLIDSIVGMVKDANPMLGGFLENIINTLGKAGEAKSDYQKIMEAGNPVTVETMVTGVADVTGGLKTIADGFFGFFGGGNKRKGTVETDHEDNSTESINTAYDAFEKLLGISNAEVLTSSYHDDETSEAARKAYDAVLALIGENGEYIFTSSSHNDDTSKKAEEALNAFLNLFQYDKFGILTYSQHDDNASSIIKNALYWISQIMATDGETSHTKSVHDEITNIITNYVTDGKTTKQSSDKTTKQSNDGTKEVTGGLSSLKNPKNKELTINARSMFGGTILRGATLFGWDAQGIPQIGGGEGPEAVVGVGSLNQQIKEAVREGLSGIAENIAAAVQGGNQKPIYVVLDTGELVGAIGSKMDAELGRLGNWKSGGAA